MATRVPPITDEECLERRHRFFRRRYVWQWPVRVTHWVNAISIAVLFLTGLYIAKPSLVPSGEAWKNFIMGQVRQLHFLFAFVFLISFPFRIYWFWVGNNSARSGFPMVWKRVWWNDLLRQLRHYLRLERGDVHLGHNALGCLAYTVFVICFGWAQILTGLALYGESNPGGLWDRLLGWVIPLLGGSFRVHLWHHTFAWMFLVFAILHIYIVFYDGQQYKNGLLTSIISGVKFYQERDLDSESWIS